MARMSLLGSVAAGCVPHLYTGDGPIAAGPWVSPENGWEIVEPPAELVPEGFEIGQTVPDLRLVDQFGDEVSLWQFHGKVILLDVSTIWCAPCQDLGAHTEETWQAYRDQGFVYLTVIQQDIEGNRPEPDDIQGWVDAFGITAPVVADGDLTALGAVPSQGGAVAYPGVLLIGRDLQVIDGPLPTDPESVDAAVREAL
jgi:peroxiredoxin